jgi:hypothetical protein
MTPTLPPPTRVVRLDPHPTALLFALKAAALVIGVLALILSPLFRKH